MKQLLVINSSARVTRSLTRRLTARAETAWLARHPNGRVQHLDVGLTPPPAVDEAWIAAAYTRPVQRTAAMGEALRAGDRFIDQLIAADAIAIGAPMYNFGPPAQLKAFFEQVVRIGRTFDFSAHPENPYVGLLADKPVLIAVSAGGPIAQDNLLEPQLTTILNLVGLQRVTFVRVPGQQGDPEVLSAVVAAAEQTIDGWVGDALAPAGAAA